MSPAALGGLGLAAVPGPGRPLFRALAAWTGQGDPFLPTPFVTGGHLDSAWAKAELHTCSSPRMPGRKSPQALSHSGFSSEGQAPAWAGRQNAVFIGGGMLLLTRLL